MEPAADLWRRTLSQIPTIFGQLVYLASLRNSADNRYIHDGLTPMLGIEVADRMLCHSHHQVFSRWIGCSLAEQKSDLDEYLSDLGGRKYILQQYRDLIPPTARDVERQLYLTDLETLLELLRYGHGGASASQGG